MFIRFLIAVVVVQLSALHLNAQTPKPDEDLEVLAKWMDGSFSSELQSKADTTYFDVRLHMKRIWNDRTDGYWFVVEQAMSTSMDKPYRQRVYQVHRVEENMIESRTFTWKNPIAVVGAWRDSTLLEGLGIDDLVARRGCELYMQMDGLMFFGSTHGTACSSEIRGASYATSEVKILYNRIISWDRGFSADGVQVWGAKLAGYVFMKD
ncbi:MAG: chromophore lyase CpcT/CpeT [Candidatus Kapabacteria bacterium]|nr:chromophore lyase CpcT/CpeT [Candidatus Kapabacteria bacterium]